MHFLFVRSTWVKMLVYNDTAKKILQGPIYTANPLKAFSRCVGGNRDNIWSWKTSRLFFAILLVVATCYALLQYTVPETVIRRWREIHGGSHEQRCADVLEQMRYGTWRKRRDLPSSNELHRKQQDLRIRKLRGLPMMLHRDDLRCGSKFPLDSSKFGVTLPSLCDAESTAPCCNHDEGRCGSGKDNCSCDKCTDFRDIVAAELHEFVPSSGCRFRNFTNKDACDFLSERVSSLTIIGDSLVRHLHNAMFILLTDDSDAGSLIKDLDDSEKNLCSGDMQFVDGGKSVCHSKTAQQISQLPEGKFCRGKFEFEYSFQEFYSLDYADSALNEVHANLDRKNSVVVIGVGIHMALNSKTVIEKYVRPIVQLKETHRSKWPLLMWLTIHAPGSLKPVPYLRSQSSEKVARFNQEMRTFLEPRGIAVFDTFNLTRGVHSYDGTHYGAGVNMMKAHLLMNYLEETFREKKTDK